jgi:hypothetical protein
MVLSSEHCVVQHLYTPLESVKRSPPQELKLHLATVEAIDLEHYSVPYYFLLKKNKERNNFR